LVCANLLASQLPQQWNTLLVNLLGSILPRGLVNPSPQLSQRNTTMLRSLI
jgi:hypothetical protein